MNTLLIIAILLIPTLGVTIIAITYIRFIQRGYKRLTEQQEVMTMKNRTTKDIRDRVKNKLVSYFMQMHQSIDLKQAYREADKVLEITRSITKNIK